MLDRNRDLGRPERSRRLCPRQSPPIFSAYDKLAEKFRTALEARISYRSLLVQVSEGDRPPKDTSEEEIEEWNASAVIIPSVDPGYECWTATERIPFACLERRYGPDCSNPVRRTWAA